MDIFMDIFMDMSYRIIFPAAIPSDLVNLIAEIDEFKGQWQSLKDIAPDRIGKGAFYQK